jgi:hypothetical protein
MRRALHAKAKDGEHERNIADDFADQRRSAGDAHVGKRIRNERDDQEGGDIPTELEVVSHAFYIACGVPDLIDDA